MLYNNTLSPKKLSSANCQGYETSLLKPLTLGCNSRHDTIFLDCLGNTCLFKKGKKRTKTTVHI